jgi:hypothetical protein
MKPLSERLLEAADTLAELNKLYDLGAHVPWEPESLRREALIVAAEEAEAQSS